MARWRDRYLKDYVKVGVLLGRYYDTDGLPTHATEEVANLIREAGKLEDAVAQEHLQFPGCNSRWSQGVGGEVWCDDDPVTGRPRWPRHMYSTLQKQKRCVCVSDELLTSAQESEATSGRFAPLDNCPAEALRCRTPG